MPHADTYHLRLDDAVVTSKFVEYVLPQSLLELSFHCMGFARRYFVSIALRTQTQLRKPGASVPSSYSGKKLDGKYDKWYY